MEHSEEARRSAETPCRERMNEAQRIYSENPCEKTRVEYLQTLHDFADVVMGRKKRN